MTNICHLTPFCGKIMTNDYLKLCLITNLNSTTIDNYLDFIHAVSDGGVTCIQIREKTLPYNDLKSFSLKVKNITIPRNIPLIINDNVQLAKEIDADGVHLGQSDMSPATARNILGQNKIIGLSIESIPQLEKANNLACINYIAASAIFNSKSKNNCKQIWELEGLKKISKISLHPIIAIGGINLENVENVINSGAHGVAVISALHEHHSPKEAAKLFLKKINKLLNKL